MFNDEIGHKARGLFHYGKPQYHGFKVPPTNYYFRPFHIHLTQQLRASICTPTGQVKLTISDRKHSYINVASSPE